jgi:CRP-like cAMP-binding protein
MRQVSLPHGHHVIVPDEPVQHVYFPVTCLLSLVTAMEDGSSAESGTIGREGMSGIPVILGTQTTPMPTFAQVPGDAIQVKAAATKEAYDRSGAVRDILNRYIHAVVVLGSQSTACNAIHEIQQRCARWLLMSSDGVGSDEIALTQEFLATMLAVRRSSVTEVLGRLRDAGMVAHTRGRIRIVDRDKLEAAACECYAKTRAEYERVIR